MQEAQVTIEGERFPLEAPFLVIATQNPIELEGTYPLPEAQLDRFLMRLGVGYPEREEEVEILARRRRAPGRRDHPRPRDLARRAAGDAGEPGGRARGRRDRALHRGPGAGHARRSPGGARRLAPRRARAAQALARPRRAAAPRFRAARRREGHGRARARPPARPRDPSCGRRGSRRRRSSRACSRRCRPPAPTRDDRAGDAARPVAAHRRRLGALARRPLRAPGAVRGRAAARAGAGRAGPAAVRPRTMP